VAIWQVPVELVPIAWTEEHGSSTEALYDEDGFHDTSSAWKRNQPIQNLEDVFGKILPKSTSSDDEVSLWGSDKKHDISAWYEGGSVVSIGFRIDIRESINELLSQLVGAAQKLNCQFFITGQQKIIEPNIFELKTCILKSIAAKFVNNPIEFLKDVDNEQ
jgi:hypothetical protein